MDNSTSLLPGRNPSGSNLAMDYSILPGTGSSSGANPIMPPINLPSGAPQSNPYTPGSVVPTFGANSGPYQTTNLAAGGTGAPGGGGTPGPFPGGIGGMSGMTNKDVSRMFSDLKKTYGDGIAHALMNFLSSGAGFNQAAINNLFAALQPGINRGTESLMEQFSTSGNRFGSGAQIGLADYLSQVQLNEGQIEAQMYETSVSDYINTLMDVANRNSTRIANSPSLTDKILSPISAITGKDFLGGGGGGSSSGGSGPGVGLLQLITSLGAVA
jgi:hypothetical protein